MGWIPLFNTRLCLLIIHKFCQYTLTATYSYYEAHSGVLHSLVNNIYKESNTIKSANAGPFSWNIARHFHVVGIFQFT